MGALQDHHQKLVAAIIQMSNQHTTVFHDIVCHQLHPSTSNELEILTWPRKIDWRCSPSRQVRRTPRAMVGCESYQDDGTLAPAHAERIIQNVEARSHRP